MMPPVAPQLLTCQDKGEQLGRAFTTGAVRMHRCEGIQLSTAGREEPEGAVRALEGADVLRDTAESIACADGGG